MKLWLCSGRCQADGHRPVLSPGWFFSALLFASVFVTAGSNSNPAYSSCKRGSSRTVYLYVLSQEGLVCLQDSLKEVPRDETLHNKSWTWLQKGFTPAAEPVSAHLWKEDLEEHCQSSTKWPSAFYSCSYFWPKCQKQTPWRWHERPTSFRETCAHKPELSSLTGIHLRTPELASHSL